MKDHVVNTGLSSQDLLLNYNNVSTISEICAFKMTAISKFEADYNAQGLGLLKQLKVEAEIRQYLKWEA
jgi:hypothetical protein